MRSTVVLMTTKTITKISDTACTTAMSCLDAASIMRAPSPPVPNACSATAAVAMSPAMPTPETAKTGPEALCRTCRLITVRSGTPRLRAVSTCSERISARTAVRVTWAT